jgi:DNA-binding NarL/FixJ family response regulator
LLSGNDGTDSACQAFPVAIHLQALDLVVNSKQEEAICNPSVVRVLVVDDFADWRRFVVAKLRENCSLKIVGEVSDGLEAARKVEELQPDLVLLDVGLAKLHGIRVARHVRDVAPKCKILFLSQELDPDVVRAALSAGGNGYVIKSEAEHELFTAVEAVMRGERFVSPGLADDPA